MPLIVAPHEPGGDSLGDVVANLLDFRGRTPKKLGMDWGDGDIPALSAVNVRPGRLDLTKTSHFGSEALYARWMTNGHTERGDIVITTEAPLGNVAQIPDDRRYILSQRVILLKPDRTRVDPDFLAQQMRAQGFQSLLDDNRSGTTATGIRQSRLIELPVHLPSLAEQRRIVGKLEALQGRGRTAREAVDSIPPLIEKLRQSILAAAFRGDLTKDWRAKNPDVEPASELLKRIRIERRKKWEEAELAKLTARGKRPTDDRWKAKYVEPAGADHSKLPGLPTGWAWATVEQLSTKVVDGVHKKPTYRSDGVPFLTVKNLTAGPGISFASTNHVSEADHTEFSKRANPELGDILITKDGTLGVTRVVRTEVTFSIFVSLALVKPVLRSMSDLLEWAFVSPAFQRRFKATGSGLMHIHLIDLRAAALPIPPASEQELILELLPKLLGPVQTLEATLDALSEQLGAVERNCLSKAFRGHLLSAS